MGFSRGSKYKSLKIPMLLHKDKNLLLAFIRGLFDTDFGFCLSKKYSKQYYYPQICFASKSLNFTHEIHNALKYLGLNFAGKVYRVKSKDDRTKKGYTIKYRFDLYGHKYFMNVIKTIKLRHPKHIQKFEEWIEVNKNNPRVLKLLDSIIAETGFEPVTSTRKNLWVPPNSL